MKPYVLVLDFETANMASHSACSIGIVVLENCQVIHEECFLIQPPNDLFLFTHIHGLTWDDVKNAPTFDQVWEQGIEKWYSKSKLLVAHNIGFDQKVLHSSARHYGIEIPKIKTECTVKLARYKLGIKPANLRNVSDTLGIELNHHEALSDARASAMIYIYTETGEKPWLKDSSSKAQKKDRPVKDEAISHLNSEKSAEKLRELLGQKKRTQT